VTVRATIATSMRKHSADFSPWPSVAAVAALCLALLAVVLVVPPAHAEDEDRYERRSHEMFLPDPVLDPFGDQGPIDPGVASMFVPRVPDNVDEVPLDEEGLDTAEREEWEREMVEEGFLTDPNDDLALDRWDGDGAPPDGAAAPDEGQDPAEW